MKCCFLKVHLSMMMMLLFSSFFLLTCLLAVLLSQSMVEGSSGGMGSLLARLAREAKIFRESPPHAAVTLTQSIDENDNCNKGNSNRVIGKTRSKLLGNKSPEWIVDIGKEALQDSVFAGESFRLKMVFPKDYPSKPPSVYFLRPVPRHVHVYSNGDICLNILGRDWRASSMNSYTVASSVLSLLLSAKSKRLPPDNAGHADAAPGAQQDRWMYHDDKC